MNQGVVAGGVDQLTTYLPEQAADVRSFNVGDELILIASQSNVSFENVDAPAVQALTLNSSGRAIWELCDGSHTLAQIINLLTANFAVDEELLPPQVQQIVAELARNGLLSGSPTRSCLRRPMTFVTGIEDKPYFWWQVAIFLESFRGKLPRGWRVLVVVSNNHRPISDPLAAIFDRYQTDYLTATNYAETHKLDIGWRGGEHHAALNRIEALAVASKVVNESDMICLLDTDIFVYSDLNLDIIPNHCAVPRNWHIESPVFFSTVDANKGHGVDLQKLLQAMGFGDEFKPGGVNVFVSGAVAKSEKFIADCFRFSQALFLLGRAAGADITWMAEMPCFALAMVSNGVDYDLLEDEEILVSSCDEKSLRPGTFYHYYSDPRDPAGRGAFHGSAWCKQDHREFDLLQSDLVSLAENAVTDHERYFFQLAKFAKDRLDV